MTPPEHTEVQRTQRDAPAIVGIGGWLFRHRTMIPLPLAFLLLLGPAARAGSIFLLLAGIVLVTAGETLRVWAVSHIGAISRTRSDRLGPLVDSGPFALVRNPLYVGNMAIWTGFAVSAGSLWLVPVFVVVLGFEYHAIVRWEEQLLERRKGDRYRRYAERVPRWIPTFATLNGGGRKGCGDERDVVSSAAPSVETRTHSWRETAFSERGTLIAIAVGYALLYATSRF